VPDTPGICDGDERLQDWIDGDLDPAQSLAMEVHIADCSACRTRMKALQALDAALSGQYSRAASGAMPGEAFDRVLLERIAAAERADRAAARAQVEQQWRDQMTALSRRWRHALRATILNVVAVAALLFMLITSLHAMPGLSPVADWWTPLTQLVTVRPALTIPVAGGLAIVALWLVRTLEARP